ncbi:MAG: prealbumin-like fold domain-containing protein, partial [Aquincola sp.]|nr:prealbumin-like fold domain-containing protein [Aquincola sp.]
MKSQTTAKRFEIVRLSTALLTVLVLWLMVSLTAHAATLTINVVGVAADGTTAPVPSYRWTVEEDATKASIPGRPADTTNYSFSFHTSYMPVVAAGRVGDALTDVQNTARAQDPDYARLLNQELPDLIPAKRYYVSVAAQGYQMGGAPVVFSNGGATATVYLNQYPLPTAQISVFVFNDNSPINGAPDLPQETGLAGFQVRLIEAGGTYGMSGGEVTQDAFANPLGTTYSDANGTVLNKGSGIIKTDANGVALIKNLFPAKYTILVAPPNGTDWHQTSTIEGTKGIDAWVKNNEPSFFQEFGPPGHHVFIGFTRSGSIARNADGSAIVPAASGYAVTGRIVNTHNSRPPVYTFFKGAPVDNCWVGLNEANAGRALYAVACNRDSTFSIPNVPAGTYELVVWDEPLDM